MNKLTVKNKPFSIVPTSFSEAMRLAEIISKSSLCPKAYKDRPGDVLIAVQMGAEVGLSPMQAVQNIAVINGNPSIWGDAALALVKASSVFEFADEKIVGSWDKTDAVASCLVKRKKHAAIERKFSYENAKRAGLIGRDTWIRYPERMLQMRARSWALRDMFPDVLKGFSIYEEAIDISSSDYQEVKENQSSNLDGVDLLKNVLGIPPEIQSLEEKVPDESAKIISNPITTELKKLIEEKNVPNETVGKWLHKAEIKTIEELPETYAKKCIESLKAKLNEI